MLPHLGHKCFSHSVITNPYFRYVSVLAAGLLAFVITECEKHLCPRCGSILNAGPNYQPRYCDQCGQKVSFKGIEWKEEKELGFAERLIRHPTSEHVRHGAYKNIVSHFQLCGRERSGEHEQVEDRVV